MSEIDDKVIQTLREVAAERPDYVYTNEYGNRANGETTCRYVHHADGPEAAPGCIVGHVLHRLGVPLESLAAREGGGAIAVAVRTLGAYISLSTRDALALAQSNQDSGYPWGKSVDAALAGEELPTPSE